MNNEKIKEILLQIEDSGIEFSVTQTGKESKRVNGFYKPDTHEIFLHNLNFKTENQLIYTAVHEYTHHLITVEKQKIDPRYGSQNCKSHTQDFWAKFGQLIQKAEELGFYKILWQEIPELAELTQDLKSNYLEKNGQLMSEFGKKLAKAWELCTQNDIRYEDYIDRVLCLPRTAEKDIRRVGAVEVNAALGFENMKTIASIKKKDDRKTAEQELLQGGKSPSSVIQMMKQKSNCNNQTDPKTKLEKEKSRLEKTIAQLTQRLELVEESLASL